MKNMIHVSSLCGLAIACISLSGCSQYGYGTTPLREMRRMRNYACAYPLSIYRNNQVAQPTDASRGQNSSPSVLDDWPPVYAPALGPEPTANDHADDRH